MRASRRTLLIGALVVVVGGVVAAGLIGEGSKRAPGVCTAELEPGGNVQAFVDSLGAGDVGCLRGGVHTAPDLKVNRGGSPTAPLTVRSYPGERATIKTPSIYVPPTSTDVHLDSLNVDGEPKAGITMQLNGDRVELTNSDITNHHTAESCINLGYEPIVDPVVSGSHIHDCGKLANCATSCHDHGIYVEGTADGSDADTVGARIQDNVIEQIAGGWGIQLYPSASDSLIQRNVIRANGPLHPAAQGMVIIASGEGSHHNLIRSNTLVGNGRASIFDTYQLPSDGATASDNCIEPNGAAVWEADTGAAVRDGGGNRVVTSRLRHCDAGDESPASRATPAE